MALVQTLMPQTQGAENRSLAITETLPKTATAAAQPGAAAGSPAEAAAAAQGDGAAQATMGAEAVQPPKPSKTILSSVIRGAVTGASLMFGVNSFGSKVPFIARAMTAALKFVPFLKLGFPMGVIGALGVGAVVGGIVGLVTGLRKARKEATAFAEAQAAAQQAQPQQPSPGADPSAMPGAPGAPGMPGDPSAGAAPAGQPPVMEPAPRPAPKAAGKSRKKIKRNPEMGPSTKASTGKARDTSKTAAAGKADSCDEKSGGKDYAIRRGDTLGALAKRHGTTVAAFMEANPQIRDPNLIFAGAHLKIPA